MWSYKLCLWHHLVPFIHIFLCLYSVGTEAEGAGPTTEGEQPFKRAAGRCTRERTKCQRGLYTAGTPLNMDTED